MLRCREQMYTYIEGILTKWGLATLFGEIVQRF